MNPKWQNLPAVFIAGVIGGLAGWLIGISTSGGSAGSHWMVDLAAGIFGGGIAAVIGVFLLANTDPSQFPKIVSFALVCGLSWPAIIAAGKNLLADATIHKEITSATESIEKDLAKPSPATVNVKTLEADTTKLAEKLPSVTDPSLRQNAVQTAAKAVDKLEAVGMEKPEAVSALEAIGKKAGASGSDNIKAAATESLGNISKSESASPEVRQKATPAFSALGGSF